jgi:hypothetical protein
VYVYSIAKCCEEPGDSNYAGGDGRRSSEPGGDARADSLANSGREPESNAEWKSNTTTTSESDADTLAG